MTYDIFTEFPAASQHYSTKCIEEMPDIDEKMRNALVELRVLKRKTNSRSQEECSRSVNIYNFTSELTHYWRLHNEFCDYIDAALSRLEGKEDVLEELVRLYREMYEIDQRKTSLSAGIKGVVEQTYKNIEQVLVGHEKMAVLTCKRNNFWITYLQDHATMPKEVLKRKYHRNSEILYQRRICEDPLLGGGLQDRTNTGIRKESVLENTRVHKALQAIDFLLEFDNYWEPLWVKALVGIPDYLLRVRLCAKLEEETNVRRNIFNHEGISCDISLVLGKKLNTEGVSHS